ncbi:AAA family ATPase [Chelatococcus sp. XZ-Ab1]|uniref:AAA family ATPase n=1 Tax=Chelatococcus sp. XZ-Ab1 TaxID=3034027 RepID=UPI0023E387CE|nr:AAA family ATPase [Chelatococcus sp. XZ-Ab1]
MTFTFAPARREQVGLLIALAGASGSGKTFSALRLARGMSPEGKIAFIDTEARRGLHYADRFQFMHADMRPPFRPERFIEGIRAAEAAGAEVVIIDSASHEYDGEGGIMDWADDLAEKGVKSPGNWKEPKLAHKKMMNALLQCRASLIFCLRADEKIEIVRENGKTQVRPLGWVPICEKRFMYEMTASFTLTPDRPGIPQFDLPHKLQDQHRNMFPAGRPISEEAGRMLAAWARGGSVNPAAPSRSSSQAAETAAPVSSSQPPEGDTGADFPGDHKIQSLALMEEARSAALNGMAAYRKFFGSLDYRDKQLLVDTGEHDKNKAAAEYADKGGGAQ